MMINGKNGVFKDWYKTGGSGQSEIQIKIGIKRRTDLLPTLKKGYCKHIKGSGWRTIEFSVKTLPTRELIVRRLPK